MKSIPVALSDYGDTHLPQTNVSGMKLGVEGEGDGVVEVSCHVHSISLGGIVKVDDGKGIEIANASGAHTQTPIITASNKDDNGPPGFVNDKQVPIFLDTCSSGPTPCSLFNMGINTQKTKKVVKVRRRLIGIQSCSTNAQNDDSDSHSKRKAWDMDTEMVDSDSILNALVLARGLLLLSPWRLIQ
ncbi:unnamed protein product [Amaranthus hypochondriacus]